ncbi:hypothetical protein B0H11DRAFT_2233183 [Mycena galericulata]|nr:hypothetical protein B0H11DRAFT_2233183 [Mycena galericulata]
MGIYPQLISRCNDSLTYGGVGSAGWQKNYLLSSPADIETDCAPRAFEAIRFSRHEKESQKKNQGIHLANGADLPRVFASAVSASNMFSEINGVSFFTLSVAYAKSHSQIPLVSGLNAQTSAAALSPQEATVASLVYGFPLTQYVQFADFIANKSGGQWTTNTLHHETTLANASYHTIVLPNVDTLYSEGLIDLSGGDVVATMGQAMGAGRFFVWPFYDLYGDNFCNFGTVPNSIAGKSDPGCVSLPPGDSYAGIIYMPTIYGATLLRIEVGNATDIDHVVNSIQPGFTLTGPTSPHHHAPPLTQALLNENLNYTESLPIFIMNLTRASRATTRPSAHTYTQPSGVNLTRAASAALAQTFSVETTHFVFLGNEWSTPWFNITGDFHSAYDMRAFVAFKGYMQLNVTEALYPSYQVNDTHYSNQTYLVEWYRKPQVDGFWSPTIYDASGYLVPNDLDRYVLNNRGNMSYPNGTLLCDNPADSPAPFYMLMQSTDSPASPEWESNWLPTPAKGAAFEFLLRLYGPEPSVYNGTWKYPKITKVKANPPLPRGN